MPMYSNSVEVLKIAMDVNQKRLLAITTNIANMADRSTPQNEVIFEKTIAKLSIADIMQHPSAIKNNVVIEPTNERMDMEQLYAAMSQTAIKQQSLFKLFASYNGLYSTLFNSGRG